MIKKYSHTTTQAVAQEVGSTKIGGSIPGSSSLHAAVSLEKILNLILATKHCEPPMNSWHLAW